MLENFQATWAEFYWMKSSIAWKCHWMKMNWDCYGNLKYEMKNRSLSPTHQTIYFCSDNFLLVYGIFLLIIIFSSLITAPVYEEQTALEVYDDGEMKALFCLFQESNF